MRTLLHLSDLHFGRVDPALPEPLLVFARELAPDLVVVSGDLTQRARSEQFRQARRFLDRLPSPQIVVPGNHDVPLHNPVARFLAPLRKYRRYISDDLAPSYVDEEIAVVGINSARSLTIKDGRISREQIEALREHLCRLDQRIVKVLVSHHPFDLPGAEGRGDVIGRAEAALPMLAECGADLLLAGHMHRSSAASTRVRLGTGTYAALVVQAGTATSTRSRGEANSFNVIRIERDRVAVEPHQWVLEQGAFHAVKPLHFRLGEAGWSPVDA
jgi:3',5'-cyclic AMP phosphodiesterase CpdA